MNQTQYNNIMNKMDRLIVAIDLIHRDQINPSLVDDIREMAQSSWKRIERSKEESEAFAKWLNLTSELRTLESDYPQFKEIK